LECVNLALVDVGNSNGPLLILPFLLLSDNRSDKDGVGPVEVRVGVSNGAATRSRWRGRPNRPGSERDAANREEQSFRPWRSPTRYHTNLMIDPHRTQTPSATPGWTVEGAHRVPTVCDEVDPADHYPP